MFLTGRAAKGKRMIGKAWVVEVRVSKEKGSPTLRRVFSSGSSEENYQAAHRALLDLMAYTFDGFSCSPSLYAVER